MFELVFADETKFQFFSSYFFFKIKQKKKQKKKQKQSMIFFKSFLFQNNQKKC